MSTPKTLVVIVGPTAVGKTALAIHVAQHYHTAIISADSRQFYREMSIGTAKPSPLELSQAPHYFVNNLSVADQEYSVGDFEQQALACIDDLFTRHNVVIMAGGSGLFVDAVCQGFDELPKAPAELRTHLNRLYAEQGLSPLLQLLQESDPDYLAIVDQKNPHRIIRALEVIQTTGRPFSSFRSSEKKKRPFNIVKIGLTMDRVLLYERINTRVNGMIEAGLVEEVRHLLPFRSLNALKTVGYTELFDVFDGHRSLDDAISAIQQNTRRFAKRQLTWFRKDQDIRWFSPGDESTILAFLHHTLPAEETN